MMKLFTIRALVLLISLTLFQTLNAASEGGVKDRREKIKERIDTDGDGVISKKERFAAKKNKKKLRIPGLSREEALDRFDEDGDGKLSREERKEARKTIMLEKFDTDGDGEISEEEREAAKAAKEEKRQELLEKFDEDGDGKLSREERKNARDSQ